MATNGLQDDAPPCTIHTKSEGAFIVTDVNAWKGQDLGVYANGYWADDGLEGRDVLIPYDEIRHIEFDFGRLDEYHATKIEALRPVPDEEAA